MIALFDQQCNTLNTAGPTRQHSELQTKRSQGLPPGGASIGGTREKVPQVAMFTGEEFGTLGSNQYYRDHAAELRDFVFALESDEGVFSPRGLGFTGSERAQCILRHMLQEVCLPSDTIRVILSLLLCRLMTPLNATALEVPMLGGPDLDILVAQGVPSACLLTRNQQYFTVHHTSADSIAVLDTAELDQAAAFWAVLAFVLGDLSFEVPRDITARVEPGMSRL
uniref:Carboxypeptidase Q n=1 Tax=Timema monikensis TaxID=170555 RepID=A0A7R9HMJ7_9NEOP|nr:unnamed protein product [Timema monikensis]